MLKRHMAYVEEVLLATARVTTSAGHPLHVGTPKEHFVKGFLQRHLAERVSIGTGEIIDANSRPGHPRNQIDIVIYRREYPKLDFGGGINAFLAEAVIATIEVRTRLTKNGLQKAIESAQNVKKLERKPWTGFSSGYQPPSILSYVVAFDGPKKMSTVYSWIDQICQTLKVTFPAMLPTGRDRQRVACPVVDGVFVLGEGFVHFDNAPGGFVDDSDRQRNPSGKWVAVHLGVGGLLYLFLLLTVAVGGCVVSVLDPTPYVSGFQVCHNRVTLEP